MKALPLFFALFCPPRAASQLPGEPLQVLVQTAPDTPAVNVLWIVSILVGHSVPSEVIINPPEIPESLSLERIRTETRLPPGAKDDERWTMVEFSFIPKEAGEVSLGPFQVVTPEKIRFTSELTIYVQGEDNRRSYNPRLVWVTPLPEALRTGETSEIKLTLEDWAPRLPLPGNGAFRVEAPGRAILEKLPPLPEDSASGIVLRLGLTPLDGPDLAVPPVRLSYEGRIISSRELAFKVLPAPPPAPPQSSPPEEALLPEPARFSTPPPFPSQAGKPVFFAFRREYQRSLDEARSLWEQGRRAEALAALRRDEGALLSGPALAVTRRAAEAALALDDTGDEKWRPQKLFLALILAGLFSLSSLILLPLALKPSRKKARGKAVTSLCAWGYKGVIGIFVFCLAGGLAGLSASLPAAGSRGVLRSTRAYSVPDQSGVGSAVFSEGQAVRIRFTGGSWFFVESPGGRSGWVESETVILY